MDNDVHEPLEGTEDDDAGKLKNFRQAYEMMRGTYLRY